MSNHRNAIKISEGDGRYYAIWSSAEPLSEQVYSDFYEWLDQSAIKSVINNGT